MRMINLSNDKKRDAQVGFEAVRNKHHVTMMLPDGSEKTGIRVLKATLANDVSELLKTHGSAEKLADAISSSDPELDLELTGMILRGTRRVYLNSENQIAYNVHLSEVVRDPLGAEKEVREFSPAESNISTESPLRWSGKIIAKDKAVRMFVFARKYQVKHVNGLTFDFLFDMAKQLHDAKSVMLIGAGSKGIEPLVFSQGGTSYRGFLEGRIEGENYCLILHLTNLELKSIL